MSNGASGGQLPPHKLIPHTGLIVDGFKYRNPLIKAYILSHAHSGKKKVTEVPGMPHRAPGMLACFASATVYVHPDVTGLLLFQ